MKINETRKSLIMSTMLIIGSMLTTAPAAAAPPPAQHETAPASTMFHHRTANQSADTAIQLTPGYMVGRVLFPEMAAHHKEYTWAFLPEKLRDNYDKNYKNNILARIKIDGKWGLIGTDGKIVLTPVYKELSYNGNGIFAVTVKNKKDVQFIDAKGNPVTPPSPMPQLMSFKENGRYGFKNSEGYVIILPILKDIFTPFSEGIAFVRSQNGKKIAINTTGTELFEAPYDKLFPFHDGLAEYQRKVSHFNWASVLVGAVVGGLTHTGLGYYPDPYSSNMGLTYDGLKRGYLDTTGQIVIDSKLDQVYPMMKWGTFVKNTGKLGLVNRRGAYIITPGNYEVGAQTIDDEAGLVALKNADTGKIGIFNFFDGTQVVKFAYDSVTFLGSQRMVLQQGSHKLLIDQTTGTVAAQFANMVEITPFQLESHT